MFISTLNSHSNKENYGVITFGVNAYDKQTKKDLENVTVIVETFYNYTTPGCRSESAPVNARIMMKRILSSNKDVFSKKEIENYKKYIKEAEEEYQKELEWEKTPSKDTLTINSPYHVTRQIPYKKYSAIIKHPDYETLYLSGSADGCGNHFMINAEMIKTK